MYMQRIEVPAQDVKAAKPRKSTALKLAAGLAFIGVGALVMLPWTIAMLLWAGLGGLVVGARKLAGLVHDTLVHAGELVVGR